MPTFGEGHYEDELNGMPHHEEMEHPAAIEPDEAMEHPAAMEPYEAMEYPVAMEPDEVMEHPVAMEPDEAMEHPAAMEPGTTPLENTTGENFLEPPFLQLPWHAMLLQTC